MTRRWYDVSELARFVGLPVCGPAKPVELSLDRSERSPERSGDLLGMAIVCQHRVELSHVLG
jgi:hypothetical protein